MIKDWDAEEGLGFGDMTRGPQRGERAQRGAGDPAFWTSIRRRRESAVPPSQSPQLRGEGETESRLVLWAIPQTSVPEKVQVVQGPHWQV